MLNTLSYSSYNLGNWHNVDMGHLAISLNSLYSLKLTRMAALSGTSYSLFSLLSLGSIIPRLSKSMPQDMLAENELGTPAGKLVRSNVTAITGIL